MEHLLGMKWKVEQYYFILCLTNFEKFCGLNLCHYSQLLIIHQYDSPTPWTVITSQSRKTSYKQKTAAFKGNTAFPTQPTSPAIYSNDKNNVCRENFCHIRLIQKKWRKGAPLINLAERSVIKRIRYDCSYTKKMASYYHHVAAHAFLT